MKDEALKSVVKTEEKKGRTNENENKEKHERYSDSALVRLGFCVLKNWNIYAGILRAYEIDCCVWNVFFVPAIINSKNRFNLYTVFGRMKNHSAFMEIA